MSRSKTARRGSARQRRGKRRRPAVNSTGTRKPVNVREALELHLVGEPGQDECWVHTHGMADLGLPELEIRSVMPRFLMPDAAHLLMDIADYMLNSGKTVRVDEVVHLGDLAQVCFSVAHPANDGETAHYAVERWSVLDVPDCSCPFCQGLAKKRSGNEPAPGQWLN